MLYSVLLAGGQSSRMGRNKILLKIDNQTLLDRAFNLLQSSGSDRIFISGEIKAYDCVPDILPHCGPLGGIYSILDLIKKENGLDDSPLLIIPVDMPILNVDALARLVVHSVNEDCVHYENEIFPCVLKASESLYDHLSDIFSESTELGGKRSMKGLIKHLKARAISVNDLPDDVFMNVNRPEDWDKVSVKLRL